MKDLSQLLDSMLDVAESVAPLLPYGPQAVEATKKVVVMIDKARETFGGDGSISTEDQNAKMADLVAQRDRIEREVNARVDKTVADLRGKS